MQTVRVSDRSERGIACATERTVKHLQEDVKAAELIARLVSGPCVPPARETLRELHQLVTSGAAFGASPSTGVRTASRMTAGEADGDAAEPVAGASQMSAGDADGDARARTGEGQMSAAEIAKALGTRVTSRAFHGGRLKATPPASDVRWQIGRNRHTVVEGRRKGLDAAR
jgi:hypothetical protein